MLQFDLRTERFSLAPGREKRTRPLGLLRDGTLCVQTSSLEPGGEPARLEVYDGVEFRLSSLAPPPPGLGNETLLYSSQSGNVWLAGTKGIARLRDQKWQMFAPPRARTCAEGFTGLVEITEDKIWCGFRDGIWEYDGKSSRPVRTGLDHVNALLNGRDSGIWAACDNGLQRFYKEAWNAVGVEEGLPGAKARTVYEDRGQIWPARTAG